MVRTKADAATARVSGAKAPRKIIASPSASVKKASNSGSGGGGNPYCPRETPKWQKAITTFFQPKNNEDTSQTGDIQPNDEEQMTDDAGQIEASNVNKSDEGEGSSEAA